ncbi:MAG: type 1 glutamine amidotransferase [Planctomycetota bacterium]
MAIVIFEHSADCPADLLIDTFRGLGQKLRVVKLHAGQPLPADLDDTHGVVSLGGPQTVHEMNAPWMQGEMGLLRDAHGAGIPVLGLCLGAQLLAAALGGETGRMPAAEVGWKDIALTPQGREDALFAGQPWKGPQFCWHSDHVSKLPDGATLLASSASCKVQAFSMGLRTYGVQYHPEWNAATVKRELEQGAAQVKAAGESLEGQLALTAQHAAASERLARRFFESCSLLLMPADRLNKGIVKDLHH